MALRLRGFELRRNFRQGQESRASFVARGISGPVADLVQKAIARRVHPSGWLTIQLAYQVRHVPTGAGTPATLETKG
jgi:hypothetical protein